jgi:hypothetical protein
MTELELLTALENLNTLRTFIESQLEKAGA